MPSPALKLVLLPGMDGTGELFAEFINAIPGDLSTVAVRYPANEFLSYKQLETYVEAAIPTTDPFVLLAESFSTPLAICIASINPSNLRALVLCAGFSSSPIQATKRILVSLFAPLLFRLPLPNPVVRHFLLGPDAHSLLVSSVQAAIALAEPNVLTARLRAIFKCDARTELSQVEVPILYLQGNQDRMVSAWSLKEILEIRPKTTVAKIDGPHLILQREPKRCAEAVAQFVANLPTR